MSYNSRQSNMFRSSQQNPKTPAHGNKKQKKQQQQQLEHDLTLTTKDIIECLTELGINFSADDLHKPTPLRVQYLFECFVSSLMGVSRESVEPIIRAASQDQEFPDAHFESAMLMAFYASLSTLMTECGVTDFSFNDIFKPEYERLRFVLSNVINFLRYRGNGKQEFADSFVMRSEQRREAIERLHDENEVLAARAADLRAQRERELPAFEKAQENNHKLTEELRGLKKRQGVLIREVEELKTEKSAQVQTLQDRKYLIQNNRQECAKLRPYVMDSPGQLRQVIVDLGESLAREREGVDIAERQTRALQTSADSFSIVNGDVTNCIKVMEDCQKELTRQEEVQKKLQRHLESLHQKETEVKEIERKEERLRRTLANAEEKLERARNTATSRRQTTKEEMERLKAEYNALSEERSKTNRQIDKINSKTEIKQKEMNELRARLEEEVTLAHAEYDKLSSHINLYMSKLEQMMNSAS